MSGSITSTKKRMTLNYEKSLRRDPKAVIGDGDDGSVDDKNPAIRITTLRLFLLLLPSMTRVPCLYSPSVLILPFVFEATIAGLRCCCGLVLGVERRGSGPVELIGWGKSDDVVTQFLILFVKIPCLSIVLVCMPGNTEEHDCITRRMQYFSVRWKL